MKLIDRITEMSFLESVLHNFNKAAALTGLSEPQIGT